MTVKAMWQHNDRLWGHSCGTTTGARFNIKMLSYQYRKSHCGDKTAVRSSYLHNGISNTGKMSSLYWIGSQITKYHNLVCICGAELHTDFYSIIFKQNQLEIKRCCQGKCRRHWKYIVKMIQLSAVNIQSNLSWYYHQHCDDSSRTYNRLQTHNRHPIPRPHRWAMGCLLWRFGRKFI